jgi:hypothetical protein
MKNELSGLLSDNGLSIGLDVGYSGVEEARKTLTMLSIKTG